MHSCHWPGAGIWLRQERKLVTASLSLHFIDGYKCFRYWNEVFYAVFQVLDWSFLVLHFDGSVCIWIPKVIWPWMDWFWCFLFKNGLFRWSHIYKDWKLKELFNYYSFWRLRILSTFKLKDILVCCLKTNLFFSQMMLPDRLKSLMNAIQFYFSTFCVYQLFFLEVVVKFFGYSRKLNRLFIKFCLKCLLGCYLVYSKSCALKDINRVC